VSNGPYIDKRLEIVTKSLLALNKYFQDVPQRDEVKNALVQDVPKWDEVTIRDRGESLFETARAIWPHGA
jgi:hypothetical protein